MTWENKGGQININYEPPQDAQLPFFKSKQKHIAYGGAKGGGKSWAMRMKFILLAATYPGLRLLLLRRTYPELRRNHIKQLYSYLVPCGLATYNDSKKEFTFVNGSTLELGSCEHEKDAHNYQGAEYDVIGFEEATHFTEYQRNIIISCLRTVRTDFSPRVYYTANPGGVGHAWFKRLFIDRDFTEEEKKQADEYIFFRAKVTDNKILMENDPDYYQRLLSLPDELKKAYLDGNWDVFAGQYFSEWSREKHVVVDFIPPKRWKRIFALDYGLDMTAALWGVVGPDGEIYIYRELYEKDLTLGEAAKAIMAAQSPGEEIDYKVASPDLWNRRQDRGQSGVDIMRQNGLTGLRAANNSRVPGWRVLKEYLKHDAKEPNSIPKLRIFESCVNLIRCLPLLQYSKRNIEDAASEPHEITHLPEALRYMVMPKIVNDVETKEPKYPIGYLDMDMGGGGEKIW